MIDGNRTANPPTRATHRSWRRLLALFLVVAAIGLPINQLYIYTVVLIATALIFSGDVTRLRRRWIISGLIVLAAIFLPLILQPAPIQEGENVFLAGKPDNALKQGLPPAVYQNMEAAFDALYPPSKRCDPATAGCWLHDGFPDRAYAFSADGIFSEPAYSRPVSGIDFSDAVWLRLGFINDVRYNWSTDAPDVHRGDRDRRFWRGLWRWQVTMPWFVMYNFPADYVGSNLCWRGEVLWEGAGGHYEKITHTVTTCRAIDQVDIGRKIFGVAIRSHSLSMTLQPPAMLELRQVACALVKLLAVAALLMLLVRVRNVARVFLLIGIALIVIAIMDASFIGGLRPFDGGDDGLFYSGVGRTIVRHLLDGNFMAALAGSENVYYYGGPGLRYFCALQMFLFGETQLGYLSLVLLMPIIVLQLFRRFLSRDFAWLLTLIFTALPLGEIFGSSFFHYAKWAARGFADPAAQILLLCGLLVIVGPRGASTRERVGAMAGAALLLALAVFIKPIVAPIVGVLLGGAGLAALMKRQWGRVLAMCFGFLPVLLMPLHNWYFGHVFVLLSSNARLPGTYVMPPSAYISALLELLRLDFAGEHIKRAGTQIADWLSGPGASTAFIPLHVAAVAVVAVTVRGRQFDPWLRLIAAALLAEYVVALIYATTPRYFYEMWLLTALVVAAFLEQSFPIWTSRFTMRSFWTKFHIHNRDHQAIQKL